MNEELIKKAKDVRSVEDLLALAKEENIALTKEQAKEYFAKLQPPMGELSDDELDAVAGGGCGSSGYASASIDGHYYKLVNDRTDSCSRFTCRACGGGRGNHAAGCDMTEGLGDVCMCCIHNAGHQLIGDYCKLQYK